MKRLVALLCWTTLAAWGNDAKLIFSKSFPGSIPAYCWVEVMQTGQLTYKEAADDPQPLKAQMSATETAALFTLAGQLDYFKNPLESGLKVANTGKKTFRYEAADGKSNEVVFNYSLLPAAQHLLDSFENIAASERAWIDLDRTMRFDRLGINDSLAQVESLWLKKQLAAPEQFFPLLDKIVSRQSLMHLVRDRAARLKDEFQAAKTADGPVSEQK